MVWVFGLAVVSRRLHPGLCDILPMRGESRMTTGDFITALFYEVDEQLGALPKHPEARLWPSEVVTLGLLHALKGVGNRAFCRRQTLSAAQSVGVDRGVGVCHRQCRG